jgi:DNA invertase Pin-like site-specific DNA recombinase
LIILQAEKIQTNPRKAAIYCRVASADDYAIRNQLQTLRDFAAGQMYEDCAEYLDNGVSGMTLDRPAFTQLRNDIRTGKIDVVFVKDTSRIGRDMILTLQWLDEMRTQGVRVIPMNEGVKLPYDFLEIFLPPKDRLPRTQNAMNE